MTTIHTEVLVVGAGLTGATAALLLARHGVDTMMVSRGRWVADSPRAHIVNQRSMEVMRAVGLEQQCYDKATPAERMGNHVMMTAVAGREFGRLWTFGQNPSRVNEFAAASPGHGCDLPQHLFEPILVGEAARLGVETRFRTMFISLEQDADGVTTQLEDRTTGERYEVRSRYVIGADGGQSPIAEALALPLSGTPGIAPALNVRFHADLSRYVAHRPGSLYWIMQPDREGSMGNAMLRMVRPWTEWVIGFVHLGASVADLSEEQIVRAVRDIIQDDTIDVRIDGVFKWRINQVIADRYAKGRVFCAGDAVHRHPPMNGLGGNTCIQDSFNLAWKIVAVLRWGAGEALLETYDAERQPVGRRVVERAVASWRQNPEVIQSLGIDPSASPQQRQQQFEVLFADSDEGERVRAAFEAAKRSKAYSYHAHGVEMNQIYSSTAVIDSGEPPLVYERDEELYFQASSRPGSRVPHCWIGVEGRTRSTLDLTSPERFTLLARTRGQEWLAAADKVGAQLGVPLEAFRIGPGCEVADLYGQWSELSEVGEHGCVLVRPDQHVAWRSTDLSDDPVAELSTALRATLSIPAFG